MSSLKRVVVGVVLLVLMVGSGAVYADNARYMDQVHQYNQRIAELRQRPGAEVASSSLTKAEGWLKDAQNKIVSDDLEEAEMLLRRTAIQLDYADAQLEVAMLSSQADTRESEAEGAEKQLTELDGQVRQMREREAELKAQIAAVGGPKP